MSLTVATIDAARKSPMHPALRWKPLFDADEHAGQHRRTEDGGTVCGLSGPLTLADTTEERCTRGCWE